MHLPLPPPSAACPYRGVHSCGASFRVLAAETYIRQQAEALFVGIMKLSARNQLPGKVKKIETGMIVAEIVIELDGGGEITSIITKKAMENLGLTVGKKVHAVIKSTEVMVAAD